MSVRASASTARTVAKQADTAAERRLSRLALDVHDGPMQNLAAIGFSLGDLQRRVSTVVPAKHRGDLQVVLSRIEAELSEVEGDLRELIASLDGGAREPSAHLECRALEHRNGPRIATSDDPDREPVSTGLEAPGREVHRHLAATTSASSPGEHWHTAGHRP